MAGKRGRPPKTPNSSSKKSPSIVKRLEGSSSKELSLSDEEALEDIDSLTPKKAAELSNVTPKWVEKKKPSSEDIEKIDDCLRANDEKAMENVVKQANGENSQPSTSYVEETPESTTSKEGASINVQDKGKEKVVECVQEGSDSENTQPWIPKAKERWVQEGDQNTAYFHSAIRSRQYKNKILSITTAEGVCIQDQQGIMDEFVNQYAKLYARKEMI
ncbi:hypothetical protein RIF29_03834 [Crotalaria pallida]|uniref:Ig-like domain-containing protein n=1 Tax=Crotalaria pallida TaxID=3830 RepID=A0AAN9J0D8_CROPI